LVIRLFGPKSASRQSLIWLFGYCLQSALPLVLLLDVLAAQSLRLL
jgi:hypothetical protein